MLVWAGLAAAIGLAFSRAVARAAALGLGAHVRRRSSPPIASCPIAVWGYPAPLAPLLLNVALAAGVIVLPLVLATGDAPEERDDEHLQVD